MDSGENFQITFQRSLSAVEDGGSDFLEYIEAFFPGPSGESLNQQGSGSRRNRASSRILPALFGVIVGREGVEGYLIAAGSVLRVTLSRCFVGDARAQRIPKQREEALFVNIL